MHFTPCLKLHEIIVHYNNPQHQHLSTQLVMSCVMHNCFFIFLFQQNTNQYQNEEKEKEKKLSA